MDDLLNDLIVQLVMRRDGVTRDDVLSVITEMRRRLFGVGSSCYRAPLSLAGESIRLAA